ncbi:MAG: homoserine kinase [Verrucomicrobiota bacterium]|jgi:homoserine kinase
MTTQTAVVRVPGTTANLGSGFDVLGIALKLYNRVAVTRVPRRGVRIVSPISDEARAGATQMVEEASSAFFRKTRTRAFGWDVSITGDVPVARGLGSSTTVLVGALAALDAIAGTGLGKEGVFQLANELEGHPDNAAPATFGGFTASAPAPEGARVARFPVSSKVRFVVLVPGFEVRTSDARRLLPSAYPKADVVHALGRVAMITAAFASGDLGPLAGMFDDRVHQPCRTPLIPALPRVIAAGVRAGAVGGWLSGSGSTIVCLATADAEPVGRAMQRALPESRLHVVAADASGYRLERPRP